MKVRRLLMLGAIVGLGCLALAGCGGGGVTVTITGLYAGHMAGDGVGPLRFQIDTSGGLEGNFRVPPICAGPIHITGTVAADGSVTFQGTGCGITFQGTGTVVRAPGGNKFTGSGTWTGSDGSSGTWSVTRTGATGSIGV